MVIEQWRFFSGPQLHWHEASLYNGYLRGPLALAPVAECVVVELSLPVFTSSVCRGCDSNTQPSACEVLLINQKLKTLKNNFSFKCKNNAAVFRYSFFNYYKEMLYKAYNEKQCGYIFLGRKRNKDKKLKTLSFHICTLKSWFLSTSWKSKRFDQKIPNIELCLEFYNGIIETRKIFVVWMRTKSLLHLHRYNYLYLNIFCQ